MNYVSLRNKATIGQLVDCSSSKRSMPIRVRLVAIRVSNLNGKVFPCRGKRCQFKSGLIRFIFLNNYRNISFSVLAYNIVIDKVKSLLLVRALVKKQKKLE